ncbi:hypothetical protein LJY25_07045 [Hymenobacter sp. BT175]|uniref:hypothetical protein n=1 Tax=Hymenobacter translucens TaxID=2886507 RepID=UPI001D0F1435|nr:hypothetical protein [Hymenobacter translucens]MCC2546196.1 hypothetical protein [Hymenobacter translucens]
MQLSKPLAKWEYVVACLPMVLLIAGGLLGGGIGAAGTFANLSIMRSERPRGLRIALCVGLTLFVTAVWGAVAGVTQQLLKA